jgi:glycosyltransferase involved in cell wall biosynthesis
MTTVNAAYVIVTAAHNEGRFLAWTIESIIAQTARPAKWVIVSDGSTDDTDAIVQEYCAKVPYLLFLRVDSDAAPGVLRKVNALWTAYRALEDVEYGFIANLDGDVVLSERYYEHLLGEFERDATLGVSGGLIHEEQGGVFRPRKSNRNRSVAHAAQVVRRECFEAIGGYAAMKHGGEDWHAEISARMKGWKVAAFEEEVRHLRPTGMADGRWCRCFREGRMDYSVGSHPAFEIVKCTTRLTEAPIGIGSAARLAGFLWSYLIREPRLVSGEMAAFLRHEQRERLRALYARPTVKA